MIEDFQADGKWWRRRMEFMIFVRAVIALRGRCFRTKLGILSGPGALRFFVSLDQFQNLLGSDDFHGIWVSLLAVFLFVILFTSSMKGMSLLL